MTQVDSIIPVGEYRHYKGNTYEVIGVARHSETYEELVVYKALYDCETFGANSIWVRPRRMFFESVESNGRIVPRFEKIK